MDPLQAVAIAAENEANPAGNPAGAAENEANPAGNPAGSASAAESSSGVNEIEPCREETDTANVGSATRRRQEGALTVEYVTSRAAVLRKEKKFNEYLGGLRAEAFRIVAQPRNKTPENMDRYAGEVNDQVKQLASDEYREDVCVVIAAEESSKALNREKNPSSGLGCLGKLASDHCCHVTNLDVVDHVLCCKQRKSRLQRAVDDQVEVNDIYLLLQEGLQLHHHVISHI